MHSLFVASLLAFCWLVALVGTEEIARTIDHIARARTRTDITPHVLTLTSAEWQHPLPHYNNAHWKRYIPTAQTNNSRSSSANSTQSIEDLSTLADAKDTVTLASVQQSLLTLEGRVYMTNITLGLAAEPFTLVIDTGSSDTWVAASDFQCLNRYTQAPLMQSACGFGKLYDPTSSPTWQVIPTNDFSVRYTDGEFLSGELGLEMLDIGGLTTQQTIGVVQSGWWIGDTISSGLMGLAYPMLTSGHRDLNYPSVIFSLFESGEVPPVFSLALSRPNATGDLSGGLLALGGIPDVSYRGEFVTVPIRPIKSATYAFYSIPVDGFIISPPTIPRGIARPKTINYSRQATEMIIDSGTTLIYFPDAIADYVASLFKPPAMYNPISNLYIVNCNSRAPRVAVIIANKRFYVDPRDLLNGGMIGTMVPSGVCILAIQRQGDGDAVLGDAFLKNVVAVFDVGDNEMMFAARGIY